MRLALECRRRVKEQQKRIGPAEFRNTQFSYTLGQDGVEKFVVTPELQSEDHIGRDPLPPGQVWAISPGGQDEGSGLYRIEVTEGPGGGVRILNRPAPPGVRRERQVRRAEPLCPRRRTGRRPQPPRARVLGPAAGFRRAARAAARSEWPRCWPCAAPSSSKSLRGGLVVVGGLNLGGSIDPLHNAIDVVELAVEKGASIVLMPVSARKQLFDLSDDMATKVNVLFYGDAREALIKAIAD